MCRLFHCPLSTNWRQGEAYRRMLFQKEATLNFSLLLYWYVGTNTNKGGGRSLVLLLSERASFWRQGEAYRRMLFQKEATLNFSLLLYWYVGTNTNMRKN